MGRIYDKGAPQTFGGKLPQTAPLDPPLAIIVLNFLLNTSVLLIPVSAETYNFHSKFSQRFDEVSVAIIVFSPIHYRHKETIYHIND